MFKDNNAWRPALLTFCVVVMLLALFFLPRYEIGEMMLRRVNMLSDIQRVDSLGNVIAETEIDKFQGIEMPDSIDVIVKDPAYKDSIPEGMVAIEDFSDSGTPMMEKFYAALAGCDTSVVRIAYFGDSFLEGDILTSDLRELMQKEYGGCGVGFVDIDCVSTGFRQTVRATRSNWEEHVGTAKNFNGELQGINGRYFFMKANNASFTATCVENVKHGIDHADDAFVYFTPGQNLVVSGGVNGEPAKQLYAASEGGQGTVVARQLSGDIKRFSFTASGQTNTRFYGVALDGKTGVVVDNMSIRSNTGYNYRNIPDATLAGFAEARPYNLIILQYGLSIANPRQIAYKGYYETMSGILDKLKKAYPDAAIILSSMSDRDTRNAHGEFVSYGGVKEFVELQRKLAADQHIAFWNFYEAMGGEGSMAKLTAAGEANKDYTHINFKGGKRLAQIVFDVLKNGKENFDRKYIVKRDVVKKVTE